MHNLIEEAITEAFGPRCPEYAEGFPCCDAWVQYDNLRAASKHHPGIEGLGAFYGYSLLGMHNGIMDDEMFNDLVQGHDNDA